MHVDLRDRIILVSSTHKNNSQKQKLLNYGTNGKKKIFKVIIEKELKVM